MTYSLVNMISANARFVQNQDGTITANGVIAQVGIVGTPQHKFIQSDIITPGIVVPADTSASGMQAYLIAQATAYVNRVYPNS